MKLLKFCTLAVLIILMAGCQKSDKAEIRIVSLSPQTAVENQTNSFKLRLKANHPEGDYYIDVRINDIYQKNMVINIIDPRYTDMEIDIDVPEVDSDRVEFVAELGMLHQDGNEVVATDSVILPVIIP